MKLLISVIAVLLSACAVHDQTAKPGHVIGLASSTFLITQLTAGTWAATPGTGSAPVAITAEQRGNLIAAIEKASGCRVTDSDISGNGMQLDAQVDCGSRLKN